MMRARCGFLTPARFWFGLGYAIALFMVVPAVAAPRRQSRNEAERGQKPPSDGDPCPRSNP